MFVYRFGGLGVRLFYPIHYRCQYGKGYTMTRVPRIKGVKYIRCQHLREGLQDTENSAWWIGDNLRVIVCPLCDKMHLGNIIAFLNALYFNGVEYRRRIEEEDKYLELFTGKNEHGSKR